MQQHTRKPTQGLHPAAKAYKVVNWQKITLRSKRRFAQAHNRYKHMRHTEASVDAEVLLTRYSPSGIYRMHWWLNG